MKIHQGTPKYTRQLMFHDADNKVIMVSIEISDYLNGYDELHVSICKDGGIGGEYNPKPGAQTELKEIKRENFLPGTPEQMQYLEENRKSTTYDYQESVDLLKQAGLYTVPRESIPEKYHKNSKIPPGDYTYGSAWLISELPEGAQQTIENIALRIEKEEKGRYPFIEWESNELYDQEGNYREEYDALDDDRLCALGRFLHLSPVEAANDIVQYEDGKYCEYSHGGILYYVCDSEDVTEMCQEEMRSYYEEFIEPEINQLAELHSWMKYMDFDFDGYLYDFIDDAANVLASYDGEENEITITNQYGNKENYFIYRR